MKKTLCATILATPLIAGSFVLGNYQTKNEIKNQSPPTGSTSEIFYRKEGIFAKEGVFEMVDELDDKIRVYFNSASTLPIYPEIGFVGIDKDMDGKLDYGTTKSHHYSDIIPNNFIERRENPTLFEKMDKKYTNFLNSHNN